MQFNEEKTNRNTKTTYGICNNKTKKDKMVEMEIKLEKTTRNCYKVLVLSVCSTEREVEDCFTAVRVLPL